MANTVRHEMSELLRQTQATSQAIYADHCASESRYGEEIWRLRAELEESRTARTAAEVRANQAETERDSWREQAERLMGELGDARLLRDLFMEPAQISYSDEARRQQEEDAAERAITAEEGPPTCDDCGTPCEICESLAADAAVDALDHGGPDPAVP
jgi:hypothetical protein